MVCEKRIFFQYKEIIKETRLHCNRMHTIRTLTVVPICGGGSGGGVGVGKESCPGGVVQGGGCPKGRMEVLPRSCPVCVLCVCVGGGAREVLSRGSGGSCPSGGRCCPGLSGPIWGDR